MSQLHENVRAAVDRFMAGLIKRNPGESEFHQAVQEVTETLMPFILEHDKYRKALIVNVSSSTAIETGAPVESIARTLAARQEAKRVKKPQGFAR